MSELSDYFSQYGININDPRYADSGGMQAAVNDAQALSLQKLQSSAQPNPTAGWTQVSGATYGQPYSVYRDQSGAMKYVVPGELGGGGLRSEAIGSMTPASFQAANAFSPDRQSYSNVSDQAGGTLVDLGNGSYGQAYDTAPKFSNLKVLYPEDSFGSFLSDSLGAFAQGPGSVIGPALGISGFMNGGFPGLSDLFSGGGSAAGGAMDMGVGGIGEAMGLGGTGAAGAAGGNMTLEDFLSGFDQSGMPDYTSPAGGNMMPPADTSGIDMFNNPNAMESAPPNWNPARPDATMLQQVQQLVQQTGLNPTSALRLLGQLGATGLGIYGANQQANKISNLSQQYANYGAPYRAMLAQSYADPSGFLKNSPDIQAAVGQGTDAMARSLSTQGNPTGSGAALQQLQNYATQGLYGQLGNERNRLANFGGLSNFNAAAPGLAGQAITAQGGALNALGSGISAITNPPTTLEQALNQINGMQGLNSNTQNWNTGTGI